MQNIPIIKLEVEGMKHTVQFMLAEYGTKINNEVSNAVERFCSSDNIERIIGDFARKQLSNPLNQKLVISFDMEMEEKH